jgi:hypothetical protein
MEQDTRIPVVFGQQPEPDDMVLLEEGITPPDVGHVQLFTASLPGHLPGCACCVARSPAAAALAAVFRARATGQAPYFKRLLVLAAAGGRLDIETALTQDILCRARFVLS